METDEERQEAKMGGEEGSENGRREAKWEEGERK